MKQGKNTSNPSEADRCMFKLALKHDPNFSNSHILLLLLLLLLLVVPTSSHQPDRTFQSKQVNCAKKETLVRREAREKKKGFVAIIIRQQ
jgi:hypothetical protein